MTTITFGPTVTLAARASVVAHLAQIALSSPWWKGVTFNTTSAYYTSLEADAGECLISDACSDLLSEIAGIISSTAVKQSI